MDKDIYVLQRCVELNQGLADNKLVKLSFGNASVRERDDSRIFIKPSGSPCGGLYNQQIACVDLATGAHLYGGKPSVDTAIHLEIYRTFPEILAVTHTHSTAATSWAQAGEAIPCFGTTHADYFSGAVPVMPLLSEKEIASDYEANLGKLVVNWFQSERVSPLDCPAVLIPFHGCLTFGATAGKALEAAVALEEIAQLALNTRMIAPAGHRPDSTSLVSCLFEKHFDRKHGLRKYYGQ